MKRLLAIVLFFSLFFPIVATCAIIEQRCFTDQFGDRYLLTGGRLGKKAYAVKAYTVACDKIVGGVVTFAKLADGRYFLSGVINGNYSTCVPFTVAAIFNSAVTSGSGKFDTYPRHATPDGSLTFTSIPCAPAAPDHSVTRESPEGAPPGTPVK